MNTTQIANIDYADWLQSISKRYRQSQIKAAVAVKKDDTKPGFFQRVGKWFREMKSELKKVIWPTPKQLVNNTVVSVCVILVSALGLWVFDLLAGALVTGLINLFG